MRWGLLLVFVGATNAFNFPFALPFLAQTSQPSESSLPKSSHDSSRTVAIIGAGAGGSSAAFFISRAKERYGLNIDIHVYEGSDYVGGRSTTVHPYDDPTIRPIELGASIFVKANKNLWRASEEFNLSRVDFDAEEDLTSIWNGETFIVAMGGGWWDKLKMAWRYGYWSIKNMDSIVDNMLDKFLTLYSPESPSWESIESLVSSLNWTELVSQPSSKYFKSHGVSENLVDEIIDAATRVNYGQNVDKIHSLEGACSLAAEDASSIENGNWQVFDRFLNASGATVFLNSTVKSIKWNDNTETWTVKGADGPVGYKAVILAAPFHSAAISIPDSLSVLIPEQPYVHLHVTLLTTTALHPNPAYFGLPPTEKIATSILTTSKGLHGGGKEPEFNSLTYHGHIIHDGITEHVVKIFSKQRISDEWLATVFSDQVGWVLRKEWDAYPKLPPTLTFPPVKLDRGFYYANAFEPFISTMETSTLAARNIVDLMLREEFGSGLCLNALVPPGTETEVEQEVLLVPPSRTSGVASDDFVLGWDC